MILIPLFLAQTSRAVIVNTGECIQVSSTAKQCCDAPLMDTCLDAESKALNEKIKAGQETLSRRAVGVHDVHEESKAKAELMRINAQLNLRLADRCEKLTKDCVDKCSNLTSSDAKYALGRCQGSEKIVADLRDQAARDEASAKRMTRGK